MDALPFTAELLREPLIVLHDSLALSGSFLHPVLLKLTLQVRRCHASYTSADACLWF